MSPETLKTTMAELDFNSADIGIITGNTRRTVQLWLSGSSPVPQSAAIILQAMKEGLLKMEWVENQIVLSMRVSGQVP